MGNQDYPPGAWKCPTCLSLDSNSCTVCKKAVDQTPEDLSFACSSCSVLYPNFLPIKKPRMHASCIRIPWELLASTTINFNFFFDQTCKEEILNLLQTRYFSETQKDQSARQIFAKQRNLGNPGYSKNTPFYLCHDCIERRKISDMLYTKTVHGKEYILVRFKSSITQ